ncbi:MAG: FHA domain-containing protein [Planctomycetes bacterium]|nr:FHA domain-containing protein [Planctomycetota bacterium]MCB9908846.1 FHA domain-containing protein [Planctomycetota bacterium]HPF13373.1 FHA domain-containing protein [Planctomycetota bacterium]HRV81170.1 FHA domain-containing protein [Planctomycetota bacterium]
MRLILQDGDTKRAIRLTDGTLLVGSAPDCALVLQSDQVAPHHARIVVQGTEAHLEVVDGQAGVTVQGEPVTTSVALSHGQLITIGKAGMKLDTRPVAEAAPAKAATQPAAPRATSARSQAEAEAPQRVQRAQRGRPQSSFPTWLMLLLAVPAVVVAWFAFRNVTGSTLEEGFSPKTSKLRIEEALRMGDTSSAMLALDDILAHKDELSTEWNLTFERLGKQAKEMAATANKLVDHTEGSKYISERLDTFANKYLKYNGRPEAREYLRRADVFLKQYPDHPDRDRVERLRAQYAKYAQANEPSTLEDLMFELKFLTGGQPRDYIIANERIAEFEGRNGTDTPELVTFKETMKSGEVAFFEKEMDYAAGQWERGAESRALGALIGVIAAVQDPGLADKGLTLLKSLMPRAKKALVGMQSQQKDLLDKCARHPDVAAFFKAEGIR